MLVYRLAVTKRHKNIKLRLGLSASQRWITNQDKPLKLGIQCYGVGFALHPCTRALKDKPRVHSLHKVKNPYDVDPRPHSRLAEEHEQMHRINKARACAYGTQRRQTCLRRGCVSRSRKTCSQSKRVEPSEQALKTKPFFPPKVTWSEGSFRKMNQVEVSKCRMEIRVSARGLSQPWNCKERHEDIIIGLSWHQSYC